MTEGITMCWSVIEPDGIEHLLLKDATLCGITFDRKEKRVYHSIGLKCSICSLELKKIGENPVRKIGE